VIDLHYLLLSALLAWLMLMTAAFLRNRGWTPEGVRLGLGNRDNIPDPTPLAGRADRASKNMLENLLLFTAVLVAARLAGADPDGTTLGAAIFFWARLAYWVVYLAGVQGLRSVIWAVGLGGIALIAWHALAV
jgi:uncharacterized MAPEG superfamily protein